MLTFWQNLPSMLDPVLFSLGPIEIRYYGLMYIVAFAVVYLLVKNRITVEKRFTKINISQIQDLFLYSFLAVIIGGRLGYVLFYDIGYYLVNPLEIVVPFNLETGSFTGISGMSFHGGLIGVIVAGYFYSKSTKISFLDLIDLIVPAVPIGYMFGRIGNFLNNELWGRETDFIGGMYVEGVLRHPSQLYQAFLEGFILFLVLWYLRRFKFAKGKMLSFFLIGYGVFRFVIEYVREPDAHLGLLWLNFSMGQWLCVGMIVAGTLLLLVNSWEMMNRNYR